ncbi:MAG: glycine cleavage system protein H [Verrucomicrobiota bacterium]
MTFWAISPLRSRMLSAVEFVRYKHARFSARFPKDYRYSRSHYWMASVEGESDLWRVGFTKFATRMLGELVEAEFSVELGGEIEPGQEIGWVEGFKAASDVFSVMQGAFQGMNPMLQEDACIIRSQPYGDGWLYAVQGRPEEESLAVDGYIGHLEGLIELMQNDPKYVDAVAEEGEEG